MRHLFGTSSTATASVLHYITRFIWKWCCNPYQIVVCDKGGNIYIYKSHTFMQIEQSVLCRSSEFSYERWLQNALSSLNIPQTLLISHSLAYPSLLFICHIHLHAGLPAVVFSLTIRDFFPWDYYDPLLNFLFLFFFLLNPHPGLIFLPAHTWFLVFCFSSYTLSIIPSFSSLQYLPSQVQA